MNTNDNDLEKVLGSAPAPRPPASLRQQLIDDIQLPGVTRESRATPSCPPAWWRRWGIAFATGGLTVVCLVVLGVEQQQVQELQRAITELSQQLERAQASGTQADAAPARVDATQVSPEQAELQTLRQTVQTLAQEVRSLEALQAENQKLRSQPALQPTMDAAEARFMQDQLDKANRIRCVNNLKQLGLAVRIWATDHADVMAPDIASLQKELGNAPKLLVCPADTGRKPAENWQILSAANISYEYLSPSAPDIEPQRVMFRCPIHNTVTLCDGSVQQLSQASSSVRLVQRDGKVYLESPPVPAQGMSEEMRRRYGLKPAVPQTQPSANPQP